MVFRVAVSLIFFYTSLGNVFASSLIDSQSVALLNSFKSSPAVLIQKRVQEKAVFYGLASYFNSVSYFVVNGEVIDRIDDSQSVSLKNGEWLAAIGRFNILLVRSPNLTVKLSGEDLLLENGQSLEWPDTEIYIVDKPHLASIAPELDALRYSQLFGPFAYLARLVEATLVFIQENLFHSWGLAIIVFSVILKIVLFPIGILTVRLQRGVSRVQAILGPQLAEIKANYDGEDAHNRIMSAHKVLGVSPFYSLKPLLGVFIQVPVWIAVFNALGEMPQLAGQSFIWIDDLAYPDSFGFIALSLPLFGSNLSILPVCMVLAMVCSTALFRNRHLTAAEVNAQKRNLYLMAAAFFILFYPFPAVMVMYWTLANMLQTVQQQIVKV